MTQTEKTSLEDLKSECIHIRIHPSGLLTKTPDLILVTGKTGRTLLPVQEQKNGSYFTVLSGHNTDKINVIGGLTQKDSGRITGKINLSHLSDNVGTCIVIDIAREDDLLFLQNIRPKQKYDPKRTSFITQNQFHHDE